MSCWQGGPGERGQKGEAGQPGPQVKTSLDRISYGLNPKNSHVIKEQLQKTICHFSWAFQDSLDLDLDQVEPKNVWILESGLDWNGKSCSSQTLTWPLTEQSCRCQINGVVSEALTQHFSPVYSLQTVTRQKHVYKRGKRCFNRKTRPFEPIK